MQYLQQNFDKSDILRVVRALAIFRPSLIALQMPLTEEDEVFVERCLQRSLIVCSSPSTACNGALMSATGARKTDILQWDADGSMEADGRDMPSRTRILHTHRLVSTRPLRAEEVYLRG